MSRFLEQLRADLRPMAQAVAAAATPISLLEFLAREVQTDNGPWTPAKHEPLLEHIQLLERIVTKRESNSQVTTVKAEQIGYTTFAIGFAVWLVATAHYNTAYFLPNDDFAKEWGMTKLNPIVDESPYLSQLVADGAVDRGVLKDFAGKFLYLLGLHKLSGATSRPNDFQVSDEVDLTSERVRKWKRGRMRHSELRCELDFSAPYAQNSGIDLRYQLGSQRRWLVR
ncbi:MAG TPA: phage terminase large subunit family protein, partial [Thermoanaerobaculia bacterium]|nr:phage terminase large subunit family protein [Thermoanaerobaculia bacterium]